MQNFYFQIYTNILHCLCTYNIGFIPQPNFINHSTLHRNHFVDSNQRNYLVSSAYFKLLKNNQPAQNLLNSSFFKNARLSSCSNTNLLQPETVIQNYKYLDFVYYDSVSKINVNQIKKASYYESYEELLYCLNISRSKQYVETSQLLLNYYFISSVFRKAWINHLSANFTFFICNSENYPVLPPLCDKFNHFMTVLLGLKHPSRAVFDKPYIFRTFDLIISELCYDPSQNNNCSQLMLVFINKLCRLVSSFYTFDIDSTPGDLFTKFMSLFILFDSHEYKDFEGNFTDLFALQYKAFMKIYKDQYTLIFAQFYFVQGPIEEKIALERFNTTCAVLDILHVLMTFLCNYQSIINGKPIIWYELDFCKIDTFVIGHKLGNLNSAYISNKKHSYWPDELVRTKKACIFKNGQYSQETYVDYVQSDKMDLLYQRLWKSLSNLIQVPVLFYNKNTRLGIKEWNEEFDKKRQQFTE